tara:strand:+ start:1253 stop:1516 length:264 start_codon:yes stop_codon:yes gene_type:complete
MFKELKLFFYILSIFFFITLLSKIYFSDNYKKKSYRSLNKIDLKINNYSKSLKILKNDTKNIIEYIDKNKNKKNKQYYFWKLLKKND